MIVFCSWQQCLILAKIHMVTKLVVPKKTHFLGLILAKIHMVTKLSAISSAASFSLILAKIHMVTKPQNHCIINFDVS